jgi:GxxExxY protein
MLARGVEYKGKPKGKSGGAQRRKERKEKQRQTKNKTKNKDKGKNEGLREAGGAMTENDVAKVVVDAAYKVHSTLGPGLLESVYQAALTHELRQRGLRVEAEKPIAVIYDTVRLEVGFRADLVVEDLVIVELKSVEQEAPVHRKQLLTYLRLADKRLGLLINFGASRIKDGITRLVNGLPE